MFKRVLWVAGVSLATSSVWGQEPAAGGPEAGLKAFLVDSSGSYVGAAGIIGLDGQVVRDTGTPKEFVTSVSAIRRSDSKEGIGFAFSPGRSRFERAVINLQKVQDDQASSDLFKDPLRRLWGSTTFSYAQKRGAVDGGGDYKQWAYAVNAEYYWNLKDDPAMAAFLVFRGDTCKAARQVVGDDPARLAEALKQARLWVTESGLAAARAAAVPATASDGLKASVKDEEAKKSAATDVESKLTACVNAASTAAMAKWNAPKLTLLVGRGQIQGTGASDPRLSLGNHVQIGISMFPEYVMNPEAKSQNQLTLSVKRSIHAVDTSTIAATPVYKDLSLAALRYTRAWEEGSSYLLAEVSNVKTKDGPLVSGTFKYAGGWDYKLGGNMWLEFRIGRSVARTGDKEETKSMLALKLSPESSLTSLLAPK